MAWRLNIPAASAGTTPREAEAYPASNKGGKGKRGGGKGSGGKGRLQEAQGKRQRVGSMNVARGSVRPREEEDFPFEDAEEEWEGSQHREREDDLYDCLKQMGQSLANALQRIQQLEGAAWATCVGPEKNAGVTSARAAGPEYNTQRKSRG